ncbi:MAG: hypothetical protein MPJ78_20075, partial [Hyphomicrobiaceae bacterium]|nr:hypothetical protein [Hyphomicrobiaceae bacterium]
MEDGTDPGRYIIDDVDASVIVMAETGGVPINGSTKMQLAFFLMADDLPGFAGQVAFVPHRLGPYSEVIANRCAVLAGEGAIRDDGGTISLTDLGASLYEGAGARLDAKYLVAIDVYKKMMNPMEHDMLLAYIYLMYPNMSYRSD